ncbi:[acyl-carrier-protein] S-malonyltransferase [cyanobiont of Ornithocercus magnificus]|nr:[acyl-carrier-protein] S-malonyltransferase [cyanobiont of Ornithocercus magnificus]
MSIAWVFPGQGSQKVGMAEPVLTLPNAEERFALASHLLGRNLLAICRGETAGNGPSDLNDTRNTQPALFTIASVLVDDLLQQGREPSFMAGHSLGELIALYAAGVFQFETGLKLILRRSDLMAAAGGGAMSAVIGFNRSELEELVAQSTDVVIANDNSSAQVVLSGTPDAVSSVTTRLRCKRVVPLAVSGAFHSPFMAEAANIFGAELEQTAFEDAKVPVLSNTDPTPSCDGAVLKKRLHDQMTTGVRWREIMESLSRENVRTLVEIGPGNVLSGLAKRAMEGVNTSQISSAGDLGHTDP